MSRLQCLSFLVASVSIFLLCINRPVDAVPPESHRIVATSAPLTGMGLNASPITLNSSTLAGALTTSAAGTLSTTPKIQAGAFSWPTAATSVVVTPTFTLTDITYSVLMEPTDLTGAAIVGRYLSATATPTFTVGATTGPGVTCTLRYAIVDY